MKGKTKNFSKGIVSWPMDERPRERLLSRGPHSLTDAELIAILVRVGFQGTNAVELGRLLLKQFGSLRAMAEHGTNYAGNCWHLTKEFRCPYIEGQFAETEQAIDEA